MSRLAGVGVLDWHDTVTRTRWIRGSVVAIGLLGSYTLLAVFGIKIG